MNQVSSARDRPINYVPFTVCQQTLQVAIKRAEDSDSPEEYEVDLHHKDDGVLHHLFNNLFLVPCLTSIRLLG